MDTLRAVIQDVKWFLFLLVLTVWGFTCAFYILFRQDQQYEVCSPGMLYCCTCCTVQFVPLAYLAIAELSVFIAHSIAPDVKLKLS